MPNLSPFGSWRGTATNCPSASSFSFHDAPQPGAWRSIGDGFSTSSAIGKTRREPLTTPIREGS